MERTMFFCFLEKGERESILFAYTQTLVYSLTGRSLFFASCTHSQRTEQLQTGGCIGDEGDSCRRWKAVASGFSFGVSGRTAESYMCVPSIVFLLFLTLWQSPPSCFSACFPLWSRGKREAIRGRLCVSVQPLSLCWHAERENRHAHTRPSGLPAKPDLFALSLSLSLTASLNASALLLQATTRRYTHEQTAHIYKDERGKMLCSDHRLMMQTRRRGTPAEAGAATKKIPFCFPCLFFSLPSSRSSLHARSKEPQ